MKLEMLDKGQAPEVLSDSNMKELSMKNKISDSSADKHVEKLVAQLLQEVDPKGDRIEFLGRQFDLGLAWVHFDEGCGGLGVSPKLQSKVAVSLSRVDAPSCCYCHVSFSFNDSWLISFEFRDSCS